LPKIRHMALQWIRFKNGKEKEVNEKLAFDPNLQKIQGFVVIDAPSGNIVSTPVSGSQKKIVPNADAGLKPVDYEKAFIKQNMDGQSFSEIAKPNGLHWKQVEKIVGKAKESIAEAIEGGKAAEAIAQEYSLTVEQVAEIVNQKAQ